MKLTLLLLTAAALSALPVLDPDSQPVPANDPRIGAYVYAIPGTVWTVWGNDNPPPLYGDQDYNDAVMRIQFDLSGAGTATWIGANSAWINFWIVEYQPVFGPYAAFWTPDVIGEKVYFTLATQYGAWYDVGSRNILVDQQTPEPAGLLLVGAGLLGIGWRRRR